MVMASGSGEERQTVKNVEENEKSLELRGNCTDRDETDRDLSKNPKTELHH